MVTEQNKTLASGIDQLTQQSKVAALDEKILNLDDDGTYRVEGKLDKATDVLERKVDRNLATIDRMLQRENNIEKLDKLATMRGRYINLTNRTDALLLVG